MDAQTLYQDQWITVTPQEIRLQNASYQVNSISSVATWHDPKRTSERTKGIICLLIAVGPWIYLHATGTNEYGIACLMMFFGTSSLTLGIIGLMNLWSYAAHHEQTWVQVGINGMPTNLISSADPAWAQRVADTIRQAVSMRQG